MTKIWERVYLGSLKDAERLAAANPFAIRSVITLCEERVQRRAVGVAFVQISLADLQPIPAWAFQKAMSAIAAGLRRGKILLHCAGGLSRAPVMAAAWMHLCGYAEFDRALGEIAELRDIEPAPVLLKSIKQLLV